MPSSFDINAGEIKIDLTQVQDLSALDGRQLNLDNDFGRIEVVVPPGLSVHVDAQVHGPGHIQFFDDERSGVGSSFVRHHVSGTGTPEISIDADLSVGEIQIHEEGQ